MKAFYAGSFDPFTTGHLSIVRKALNLFDSLVIGIGFNENKIGEWPVETRLNVIKELFSNEKRIEVISYKGLTSSAAKAAGASVLVRGVRNGIDFDKEKELADINLEVLGIPTVMIPSEPKLDFVSSSMIKELLHNGFDASEYMAGNWPKH